MILPNGVTGFSNSVEYPLSSVNGIQFKQLCYAIANGKDGTLNDLKEPEYPMNFYHASIKFINKDIHILLNKHYPFLAFASRVEYEGIEFIDVPHLAVPFASFYKVLHISELKQPVIFKNHSKQDFLQNEHRLNQAELEKIKYWNPHIVGEIIFNYWD